MPKNQVKLLLIDDDHERVRLFKVWTPPDIRLSVVMDAGQGLGEINKMGEEDYAGVMLDHDIHKTPIPGMPVTVNGMKIATRLAERRLLGVAVLVHSTNPGGGLAMAQVLRGADYDVTQIRFGDLDKQRYQEWVNNACAGLR